MLDTFRISFVPEFSDVGVGSYKCSDFFLGHIGKIQTAQNSEIGHYGRRAKTESFGRVEPKRDLGRFPSIIAARAQLEKSGARVSQSRTNRGTGSGRHPVRPCWAFSSSEGSIYHKGSYNMSPQEDAMLLFAASLCRR